MTAQLNVGTALLKQILFSTHSHKVGPKFLKTLISLRFKMLFSQQIFGRDKFFYMAENSQQWNNFDCVRVNFSKNLRNKCRRDVSVKYGEAEYSPTTTPFRHGCETFAKSKSREIYGF